jgi:hypothetical protein
LCRQGKFGREELLEAQKRLGIDPDKPNPARA